MRKCDEQQKHFRALYLNGGICPFDRSVVLAASTIGSYHLLAVELQQMYSKDRCKASFTPHPPHVYVQ